MAHKPIDFSDFIKYVTTDNTKHFYVLMMDRPLGFVWMNWMEWEYFTPGTPANNDYTLMQVPWQEMVFAVISAPVKYDAQIQESLKRFEMRLADGVPAALSPGSDKPEFFPGHKLPNGRNNLRMKTIENNSFCRMHNTKLPRQITHQREMEVAERIAKKREKLTPEEILKLIYG